MLRLMPSQLDALKKHSIIVADSGDIDAVARWRPQDATTNPSLLLAAAQDARYRHMVDDALARAHGDAGPCRRRAARDFGGGSRLACRAARHASTVARDVATLARRGSIVARHASTIRNPS